ncbi:MAG: alpha-glucosidase [Spirochaetales bacterium]|nr:alpha-glucosidase [Spirochaetales bacterium]
MKQPWWKEAVVYQIYPRSFQDSNGDGIGDLPGIVSRLDYLNDLGVNVIWLSPVYESPNDDNGYDISNYYGIMKDFGTMADWKSLLNGLHERGMKLVMDLVVNHTSDEHPWFIESRKAQTSPKREFYIWRPPRNGKEPNNWASFFSPSAWKFDPATGEYYLHLFSEKQPDLNWENPQVQTEIFSMIQWWLDQGIDGFRMDVINFIGKPAGLLDSPRAPTHPDGYVHDPSFYANQPFTHTLLHKLNREVLSLYDVMTVGETPEVTPETASLYVAPDRQELNMVFQFELMGVDAGPNGKWDVQPWKLSDFKRLVSKWQTGLAGRGWNSLYLSNHDQPRQVSRFGDDKQYRLESAKLLATLLHTLQGTPYIYQGEELGMTNVAFPRLDDYRDLETFHFAATARKQGYDESWIMNAIHRVSRDNARTPMPWNSQKNAGFTTGTPWIDLNPNFSNINVSQALADPNSVLRYYQALIRLRRQEPTVVVGTYVPLLENHEQLFVYQRRGPNTLLIILNFCGQTTRWSVNEAQAVGLTPHAILLLSNYPDMVNDSAKSSPSLSEFQPWEARVYRLES